jgi:hypothetical protein
MNCPLCKSQKTHTFLERQGVPVHQNALVHTLKEARDVMCGDLSLDVCEMCGFIFNQAFDLAKLHYEDNYDNNQAYSKVFNDHMQSLAHHLVYDCGLNNATLVEVGCGKGSFLREVMSVPGAESLRAYGFDVSYEGPELDYDGRLQFSKNYYEKGQGPVRPDALVCRHVIEHVPDPISFLAAIRDALTGSFETRVFFETPCVEWILKNRVIWDFCYEHCSYFTADSLRALFKAAGFEVTDVSHVFNGQYLWLEARPVPQKTSCIQNQQSGLGGALCKDFGKHMQALLDQWLQRIHDFRKEGNVALWGAAAKGMTFANLVDPRCELIECVADLNPNKQGCYVAGSGHPIVDYKSLTSHNVKNAILMNPNYYGENLALLKGSHLSVNLVN